MALKASLTPLVITLTQGSNDAFVQGSVLTGLTGRQAYNLKQITMEFTNIEGASLVNVSSVELAITRRSKTAIPNMSDSDVIAKYKFGFRLTTSGAVLQPSIIVLPMQVETPIVEETVYAQLDSTLMGITLVAVARLEVEIDTMSDIDRLNLITRSLT